MTFELSNHGDSKIVEAQDGSWAINQRGEINPRHKAAIIEALTKHGALMALAERVAGLNPKVNEIGAGMLVTLVTEAKAVTL